MKTIYLFTLTLFAFVTNAQSTVQSLPKNNKALYLNTNGTSFIAGETLYYTIGTNGNLVATDKIAYVVLVGGNKNAVFTHKHFLTNGDAHGDFFLPATIETGAYKIIAYTAANAKSDQIFQRNIIVINPFQTSKIPADATTLSFTEENIGDDDYSLSSKKTFNPRELVSINTKNIPHGSYSISVRKTDLLDRASVNSKYDPIIKKSSATTVIPEIRGEIISGQVTLNGNAAAKVNVALSISGENPIFKIAKTDADGKFIFTNSQMNPNNQMYVQVINRENLNYNITLDSSPTPDFSNLEFPSFRVPESLENDLRERMVAVQIRNSYTSSKADTIVPQPISQKFFEPISTEYILDKYTRFPTFAQTITELLPEVYYLKSGANFTVHVRDKNIGRTIPEPPLVLVDGIMLQDVTELFSFPTRNIEKINIVTGIYLYGPAAFNGLINITTKNYSYTPTSIQPANHDTVRPFVKKKYFRQQHNESSTRIPDFRHQLLWMPKISKGDNITFYTSDLPGNYKIEITGYTCEGQAFITQESITVTE